MKNILIAGLGWILSQSVMAEVSPQLISFNCRSCHTGQGQVVPELRTLSTEQIRQALLDFKDGNRQSTVMGRIAKGFTDTEIISVAQWIGQSK